MTLLWLSLNAGGPDPRYDQPLEITVAGTNDDMTMFDTPITRSTVYLHCFSEDPFHDPEYQAKHDLSGLRSYWRGLRKYGDVYIGKKGHLQRMQAIEGRILKLFDSRNITGALTLAGAGVEARALPYLRVWMPNLVDRLTEHVYDTSIARRLFHQDFWPLRAANDLGQALDEGWEIVQMAELLKAERLRLADL